VGPEPQFSVRLESRNGVASVALVGELDRETAPILSDQLTPLQGDGVVTIMLDVRELTFIGSAGFQAVLQASKRANADGHRLIIVGANPWTRRLFEITGTDYLLDDEGAAAALDRFTGGRSGRAVQADPAIANADV
jgi:anti-sigma B factor antagonist